jgi:hypothetical protein
LHDSNSPDTASDDLWSNLMQDETFFTHDPKILSAKDYKAEWAKVLEEKANLIPWRDRYNYYVASTPAMQSWKIKVWEP